MDLPLPILLAANTPTCQILPSRGQSALSDNTVRSSNRWWADFWGLLWGLSAFGLHVGFGPKASLYGPAAAPLVWVASSMFLVYVTWTILRGRVVSPPPNPQPWGPGITLCLVSTLRPVRRGWPYQEFKTPADKALGVIETRKLPHNDKVVTPLGAENRPTLTSK